MHCTVEGVNIIYSLLEFKKEYNRGLLIIFSHSNLFIGSGNFSVFKILSFARHSLRLYYSKILHNRDEEPDINCFLVTITFQK